MMTDARYLRRLAWPDVDLYVAEFRGHGASETHGEWSFDDYVELDLPAIVAAVPPGAALLGHSLGGLVACAALGTGRIPPPARVILAATNVWLGETLARRAIMRTLLAITSAVGRAPIRALRIGTNDEPRMYIEQLAGWARTGRWTSLRGLDYLAALATIDTPVSACCAGADWMCRPDDARRFAARITTCGPLHVIDGANHFSLFQRPELRAWILDQLA